jgi:hypothetical protein
MYDGILILWWGKYELLQVLDFDEATLILIKLNLILHKIKNKYTWQLFFYQ